MSMPRSTSHNRTVESKEADANTSLALGFGVPGPVQDHLIVYISLEWAFKSQTQVSLSMLQTFSVISSEQLAKNRPCGSHLIAFTSFVWPWKDLMGLSWPRRHTWIHLSVEQEAELSSVCQSTSNAGAE